MEFLHIHRKFAGVLKNNKDFVCHRHDRHLFKKFNGFGLSVSLLEELKKRNCKRVILIWHKSDGTEEALVTTPEMFFIKGKVWRNEDVDYQRILPLKEWRKLSGN
ncbi:hypothetical protein DRJ19_01350 [Candidatus Woesearchaeota archaeon]|nr:MAG: hypothetical protein DRJ19_01350 [Candidatus Woesearchaeota archaeon]